jgi:hypothetical protein
MFSLWSLGRMLEEFKTLADINYIGFCDYLIHSHSVGFYKNCQGIYKNYGSFLIDPELDKLCDTFEEFIILLNSNSDKLY